MAIILTIFLRVQKATKIFGCMSLFINFLFGIIYDKTHAEEEQIQKDKQSRNEHLYRHSFNFFLEQNKVPP